MNRRATISIIGPGRVGSALAVLAARAGWPLAAVGARDPDKAKALADRISPDTLAGTQGQAAAAGELILLTVCDDAIEDVCNQLVDAGALQTGAIVAHCSGALGSEVLAAATNRCGCRVASCHPLQTFPTPDAAIERMAGTYFFCEGDADALETLDILIEDIGGRAVRIATGQAKTLYHAGAVMACNYLTAMIDAGVALMEQGGVGRQVALDALAPLVRATVENVLTMGPEQALTGPAARGDTETIRRHLDAIRSGAAEANGDELEAFYRAAGMWTANLAARKGNIDATTVHAMVELLKQLPNS